MNWYKNHKTELSECLDCNKQNLEFNDSCDCEKES